MIHALTFATYAVTLNGRPVLPRARAAVVAGRVLLPVRALGEALGADVGYDARFRRIVIQRGSRVTELPANGAVRLVDGRAYAPLRSVAAAFGMDVDYAARTRTVALRDASARGADAPSAPPAPSYARHDAITTTPADGARLHEPYPTVSARFAGVSSIDPRSLRVTFDGRDVTGDAAVIGDQVTYTPRSALAPGRHDVAIDASAPNGPPLAAAWSFEDTFTFVAPPPAPPPFPISAIYLDRWVAPGTNAFDVIVRGAPGLTGFVRVEGIGGIFPFTVSTYDAYVAHVYVPAGMHQPFARVAARINLPDGSAQTIVLPQTIGLFTAPAITPTPAPTPPRRSVNVPTFMPAPSPTPPRRSVNVPSPAPTASPSPAPTPTPGVRRPLKRPRPKASQVPVVEPQ